MINVGSENGFLGVGKEFIGKKNKADYHSEMNAAHFLEWFQDVVQALPEHSVIVLDQASYHRTFTEETKRPTTKLRKHELIEWLEKHGVPVPEDEESFWAMTVVELRELAKKNVPEPQFDVEKIIADSGKDVKLLWLPVAHCELNPIELMWAAVKGEHHA